MSGQFTQCDAPGARSNWNSLSRDEQRLRRVHSDLRMSLDRAGARQGAEGFALTESSAQRRAGGPLASVVVPVFEHAGLVGRCVAALDRQTYARDRYEVILIDNRCDGRPSSRLQGFDRVHVVCETSPSSYAARNCGIESSAGEVIALTDADCVPEPDWIAKGVESLLATPGRGLVAGRVDVSYADPGRPTAVELYESAVGWRQREYVDGWRFGATANLFTFRAVFDRVGLFDPSLKSLGDREWGKRVFEAGYTQVYADEARVCHPARRTLQELRRRTARVAGGFFDIATRKGWGGKLLLEDAGLGLPLGRLRPSRADGRPSVQGPRQQLALHAVGAFVVSVRALELLRLLCGGCSRRS